MSTTRKYLLGIVDGSTDKTAIMTDRYIDCSASELAKHLKANFNDRCKIKSLIRNEFHAKYQFDELITPSTTSFIEPSGVEIEKIVHNVSDFYAAFLYRQPSYHKIFNFEDQWFVICFQRAWKMFMGHSWGWQSATHFLDAHNRYMERVKEDFRV